MRYVHNKSEEPEKKCGTYGQWKCDFLWHWILPRFITYVENKKVSISIGSNNGVRAGDQFTVYKDKDIIGFVEIEVVERESSSGNIIDSSKQISVGDRIELKKK
jgi:hypothetical protein